MTTVRATGEIIGKFFNGLVPMCQRCLGLEKVNLFPSEPGTLCSKFIHLSVQGPCLKMCVCSACRARSTSGTRSRLRNAYIIPGDRSGGCTTNRKVSILRHKLLVAIRVHGIAIDQHQSLPSLFVLIRKFSLLPFIDGRFHHLDILVGDVAKHGDGSLILKLPFGLHDTHDHVGGLVVHLLGHELIGAQEKVAYIALLRAVGIAGKFTVIPEAFAPESSLELKIFESVVALLFGQAQVQLIADDEKGFTLPDHLSACFLEPSQVIFSLHTLVEETTDLFRDREELLMLSHRPLGMEWLRGLWAQVGSEATVSAF